MRAFMPFFACGNIFTPFESAVFTSMLLAWLASLVLSIVNPCLIVFLGVGTRSKFMHLAFWAVYFGTGLTLWVSAFAGYVAYTKSEAWLIPVYAVPILTISHFAILLLIRRRIRLKKQRRRHHEAYT